MNKNDSQITSETQPQLNDNWKLYFYKSDRTRSWDESFMMISEINTIESFWQTMHHLRLPSKLEWNCDYYFFRSHIEPKWEDKHNVNGGKWIISINKINRVSQTNQPWFELLMLMIGEKFGMDSNDICGSIVSIRNQYDKVILWTKNDKNIESIKRIGATLKSTLNLNFEIEYHSHKTNKLRSTCIVQAMLKQ